ncbi:MAG: S-methyl-5'-thioinosine phosphorylase [Congregibacter sp.]
MSIALIGGTGLQSLAGLELNRVHAIDTPFGPTSTAIEEGKFEGTSLFFLHRHGGADGPIPPHRVNYRANIWALHELGVDRIVAANAVGAVNPSRCSGELVIPDQLIDYTWGREHSFDDGASGSLAHIDFTEPYDATLRLSLLGAARRASVPCFDGAVLGVTQGPRLETAAEIQRLARDGCDLVGMTGMPEAALAREMNIAYVAVCMVVNAAAGIDDQPITLASIQKLVEQETALLRSLLGAYLVASSSASGSAV